MSSLTCPAAGASLAGGCIRDMRSVIALREGTLQVVAEPCLQLPPQKTQPRWLWPGLSVRMRHKGLTAPPLGQQAQEEDLC